MLGKRSGPASPVSVPSSPVTRGGLTAFGCVCTLRCMPTTNRITDKQTQFIRKLLAERQGIPAAEVVRADLNEAREAGALTTGVASRFIHELLAIDTKAPCTATSCLRGECTTHAGQTAWLKDGVPQPITIPSHVVGERGTVTIAFDDPRYARVAEVEALFREVEERNEFFDGEVEIREAARWEHYRRHGAVVCGDCGRLGTASFECYPCKRDAGLG